MSISVKQRFSFVLQMPPTYKCAWNLMNNSFVIACSVKIKVKAGLEFLPAVRLTMDAVPAVMASTWEWISCLDSSILFLRQACDALNQVGKKC